jgi:hypothetical protein
MLLSQLPLCVAPLLSVGSCSSFAFRPSRLTPKGVLQLHFHSCQKPCLSCSRFFLDSHPTSPVGCSFYLDASDPVSSCTAALKSADISRPEVFLGSLAYLGQTPFRVIHQKVTPLRRPPDPTTQLPWFVTPAGNLLLVCHSRRESALCLSFPQGICFCFRSCL